MLVPHMGLTTGGAIGARRRRPSRMRAARSRRCTTPPSASTRRSSSSATAARSPSLTTRLRDRTHRRDRWLLRRVVDGAPAHRDRDDREHAALQVHPLLPERREMSTFVKQRCRAGAVRLGRDRLALLARQHGARRDRRDGRHARARRGPPFHRHDGQEEMIIVKPGRSSSTSSATRRPSRRRLRLHRRRRRARLLQRRRRHGASAGRDRAFARR